MQKERKKCEKNAKNRKRTHKTQNKKQKNAKKTQKKHEKNAKKTLNKKKTQKHEIIKTQKKRNKKKRKKPNLLLPLSPPPSVATTCMAYASVLSLSKQHSAVSIRPVRPSMAKMGRPVSSSITFFCSE